MRDEMPGQPPPEGTALMRRNRRRRRFTLMGIGQIVALLAATVQISGAAPPVNTTIDSGPPASTAATAATFAFHSNSGGATFTCKLDTAAAAACTSPKTYTALAQGAHTFSVFATAGGVSDSSPDTSTWTVTPPPDTLIDSGPAANTPATTANFTFHSTASAATFTCKLDTGAAAACTTPKAYTGLTLGSHTFTVFATEGGVSDASPATATWTVIPPPDTVIDSGPAASTPVTTATFGFHSTDPAATFTCKLDAAAAAACTSPKSYTALAVGSHTFTVFATDAGVSDASPATATWTVIASPDTIIDSGPAASTPVTTASFAFHSPNPAATFTCQLDGGTAAACTSPKAYAGLAQASHTFTVFATAGGVSDPSPATFTWTVTPPPDTIIDSGPAASTPVTTANFAFHSTDSSATFTCKLDAGAAAACTSPKSYTALAQASHMFTVFATVAGVSDPTPPTFTWTVTPPPDTIVDSGPAASTPLTTASLAFHSTDSSATFTCKLDGAAAAACTSPRRTRAWRSARTRSRCSPPWPA